MSTTTPIYGWPIPEGTDPISQGYDQIADLAVAVEATLAGNLGAGVQVFTTGGSLAAATVAGAKALILECWAGGAGGASAPASSAGNSAAGGGGGGGGYARRVIPTAGLAFPLAVVVPGAAAAGTNGGLASVSSATPTVLCRATGGTTGGQLANGATVGQTAGGGGGGTGDVGSAGFTGGDGGRATRYTATAVMGGTGGAAAAGGGGATEASTTGVAGSFPGGGGSGGKAVNGAGATAGGTGAAGLVLITPIY